MNIPSNACCTGIPPSGDGDMPVGRGVLLVLAAVYAAGALVVLGVVAAVIR